MLQKITLLLRSLSRPLLINIFPKDYSKSESITSLGLRPISFGSVGKKQRLFNKAKRSHSGKDWQEYKSHKKHTLQSIPCAHLHYVNTTLQEGLESNDSKPFWRYVKSKQQATVGVSPLKVDGQLHSEDKADILNKQFKSVFTAPQSPVDNIPKLSGPKTPLISPLKISTKGVEELLAGLNVKKASGPDNIPCKILQELAAKLAPILTTIFQQSLDT